MRVLWTGGLCHGCWPVGADAAGMCFGSNPSCHFLLVPSHATRSRRSTGALTDRANDAFVDQEHTWLYERRSSETIGLSVTVYKEVMVGP